MEVLLAEGIGDVYWMVQGDRVIQADGNGESLRAIFTRAWI
jgi:hypothetical protein